MSRNLCVVKDCKNTKHEKRFLLFHLFPTREPERLKQWVDFCENETITELYEKNDPRLEHKNICSEHFEDNQYNNPMKKIRLMRNAVPTIPSNQKRRKNTATTSVKNTSAIQVIPAQVLLRTNLSRRWQPNKSPSAGQSSSNFVGQQSPDQNSTLNLKPNPIVRQFSAQHIRYESEVRGLREKLAKSRKQVMNLKYRLNNQRNKLIGNTRKSRLNFILDCIRHLSDDVLNPVVAEVIENHLISAFMDKPRVNKWSDRMKKFCADLYHKSPTAYSFLQKTITLPTKKTILKFTEERIQMAKVATFKKTDDSQTEVPTNEALTQTTCEQVITLDSIDDLLANNALNYIEYSISEQTTDLIEDNCLDLNQMDRNLTTDTTNATINVNDTEKSDSVIKTYSRHR